MSSMNNLSVDGEFRYIIQWFHEWSELQRDDFIPILVEYLKRDCGDSSEGAVYMNGVVNTMSNAELHDRPMSLFQCRIKLFRQWSAKWPLELRQKLKEKIREIDMKVGEKLYNELQELQLPQNNNISNHNTHDNTNNSQDLLANVNGFNNAVESTIVVAASNEYNDNHLAAVLRQETPVDDDDPQPASVVQQIEPVERVENNVTPTNASVIVSPISTNSTTVTNAQTPTTSATAIIAAGNAEVSSIA